MTPNIVFALYMLGCILIAILVWRFEMFDMRGVSRVVSQPPESLDRDDDAFLEPDSRSSAERIEAPRLALQTTLPRMDLALLATIGGLLGVGLGAALGWLIPLALEHLPGGDGWGALTAERPMARLAQVIGAAALAVAALRMIRVFMLLGLLAAATLLALLAANYVLDRALFAGFG